MEECDVAKLIPTWGVKEADLCEQWVSPLITIWESPI